MLLAPGSVDAWNPKVVRGGMGAHARLAIHPFAWQDLSARIDQHKQAGAPCRVIAATAQGSLRYDALDWCDAAPTYVVLGGEASGLSAEALGLMTASVRIPLARDLESLNAAVACGVILFEAARQRGFGL